MFRNICFTINNWTEEDFDLLHNSGKWYSYLIYGFEMGETGTPHLQGYAELQKRMRLNSVKKILPRAHIEARKGTAEEAADYCKKEGDFEERGIISKQGERLDLDKVRTEALEMGMRGVTSKFNQQQIHVAEKFLCYNETERDWKPEVIWIWGKTGTGKSKLARELTGDDTYTKNTANKWWDGYDSHENIIIDDFRCSWWDLTYMLALIDRYAMRVEVKGGTRQILAKKIIITSAFAPNECYRGTGEAIEQLLRRVDNIIHLGVPDVPEVVKGNTDTLTNPLENI